MKPKQNNSPIILAVDSPTAKQALAVVEQVKGLVGIVKVGSVLFTSAGPQLVRRLLKTGVEVLLDLKFHDIPNTVAEAVAAAARLGVWGMTVHIGGDLAMMKAAENAAQAVGLEMDIEPPLIVGVGVLTSLDIDGLHRIGVPAHEVKEQVERLARLAMEAKLRGLVCSPLEVAMIREIVGPNVQLVVPGIRLPDAKQDDQKRVGTPRQAIEAGANWLVIGRHIYEAKNPRAAVEEILASLN